MRSGRLRDFGFVNAIDARLVRLMSKALDFEHPDPTDSINNTFKVAEAVADAIGARSGLPRNDQETTYKFVKRLYDTDRIPLAIKKDFDNIRVGRNEGGGHGLDEVAAHVASEALDCLESIGRWFSLTQCGGPQQSPDHFKKSTADDTQVESEQAGTDDYPPGPKVKSQPVDDSKSIDNIPVQILRTMSPIALIVVFGIIASAILFFEFTQNFSTPDLSQKSPIAILTSAEAIIHEAPKSNLSGTPTAISSNDSIDNPVNKEIVLSEQNARSIWSTSVYSYDGVNQGPGGGLADDKLRVGGWGDQYVALIRFDVRLSSPVSHAILSLRMKADDPQSTLTPIRVKLITGDWQWQTGDRLWWKDLPPSIPLFVVAEPSVSETIYNIDITDIYNHWSDGSINNFGIMLEPVLNNNNFSTFYSTRAPAAFLPRLILTAR